MAKSFEQGASGSLWITEKSPSLRDEAIPWELRSKAESESPLNENTINTNNLN